MNTSNMQEREDGVQYIYCPYIRKNGKIIYPKHSKVFRIPVKA